jgi:hypothetical protein
MSGRREALVLLVTHALAATLPVLPLLYATGGLHRRDPLLREWPAEEYSGRVAGLQVTIGDDAAAIAALRRHVDRLQVLRLDLAGAAQFSELRLLDNSVCSARSEIAFLADPADRDARVADAVACYDEMGRNGHPPTPERVLELGRRWVSRERSFE